MRAVSVADSREMAELKAKLKEASATIAAQKARIRMREKGLAELRASAVRMIKAVDGESQ